MSSLLAGQFAFTPLKDFTANLNWIVGPEQIDPRRIDDNVTRDSRNYVNSHMRYMLDFVFAYTGFKNLTLALNLDYGHEQSEPFIRSLGTRQNTDATWWLGGLRGLRLDREPPDRGAPGVLPGRGGRPHRRHDQSDEHVYRVRYSRPDITAQGLLARGKSMDTISVSLYYSFF